MIKKIMVFVSTKFFAEKLTSLLQDASIDCGYISSELNQKQRFSALENFKNGNYSVLVTTPLTQRGIDLPQIDIVINYDMPKFKEEFEHRIGRTGRMGKKGLVITLKEK